MDILFNKRKNVEDINAMFRERCNQLVEQQPVTRGKNRPPKPVVKKQSSMAYTNKAVDDYSSRDILDYYKNLARNNGITFYSTLNLDKRYMRNIKQLQETFDNQAILDMYTFLFESGQTYLDMRKSHPGILLTQWINRIICDTQDFIDGTFKNTPNKKVREYEEGNNEESSIGGGWD